MAFFLNGIIKVGWKTNENTNQPTGEAGIYEYRQRNFSEKWDKKISKTAVYASYTLIKGEKAKGTKFETSDMGRFRIDWSKIIEFEHELYSQINARLLKQALTFELIKIQG